MTINTKPAGCEPTGVDNRTWESVQGHSTGHQYPRKGTARADVLTALQRGQRLTSKEAWHDFGTSRLAADVFELRRMGWPIVAETITVPARRGHRSKIARYHLPATGGGDA